MLKEQWKDIEGWEGMYKISNFGRVLSVKRNIFRIPDTNNSGYLRVQFATTRKGKIVRERYFIHRLVAHHFVDGEFEGATVNHIDGNKLNNRADNLEWVTHKENSIHAQKMGLLDKSVQFKDKPYFLRTTEGFYICFKNIVELSRALGYCKQSCYNWINNKAGKVPHSDLTIVQEMPRDYPLVGVGCIEQSKRHGRETARYSPNPVGIQEKYPSMGYHRPLQSFNNGKQSEFRERKMFTEERAVAGMA